MSKLTMENILNKIKAYDRIVIFRHVRPDGDCVGATKGFQRILQLSFPEKQIILTHEDHSAYLEFLGPEDPAIPTEMYEDALGIVLDTANTDRISNKNFKRCKELCKIDHHIDINPYGDVSWVEEESSSCCEMIVKFYDTFKDQLKIDKEAATYLYTGMVTDSGRFRYSSTSGDTMRCAGILLDQGIDTERLFARLYLEAFEYLKFKAHLYNIMKVTENGVAYIFIDKEMQERFNLSLEQASACVTELNRLYRSILTITGTVHSISRISPVSMPLSVNMVVTPVISSPLMMDQLIGALPRCLGRSEEWTLIVPSFGISRISWESSWPNAAVTHRSGSSERSISTPSGRLMRSG